LLSGYRRQFHGCLSWPKWPTGFRGSLWCGRRSGDRF
jgi:hypothetical protein